MGARAVYPDVLKVEFRVDCIKKMAHYDVK